MQIWPYLDLKQVRFCQLSWYKNVGFENFDYHLINSQSIEIRIFDSHSIDSWLIKNLSQFCLHVLIEVGVLLLTLLAKTIKGLIKHNFHKVWGSRNRVPLREKLRDPISVNLQVQKAVMLLGVYPYVAIQRSWNHNLVKFTAVSNLSGGALELVRYSGCEHRWVVREQIYVEVQMFQSCWGLQQWVHLLGL